MRRRCGSCGRSPADRRRPAAPRTAGRTVLRFAAASVPVQVRRRVNAAPAWQLVQRPEPPRRPPPARRGGEYGGARDPRAPRRGRRRRSGQRPRRAPGLLLHTEGQRGRRGDAPRPQTHARLAEGASRLRRCCSSRRATGRSRDLAGEAGVSVGLAHRVLARLETEGLVAAEGAGPRRVRRVADPTALLDLWAEENTDRSVQRMRAYRLAREPVLAERGERRRGGNRPCRHRGGRGGADRAVRHRRSRGRDLDRLGRFARGSRRRNRRRSRGDGPQPRARPGERGRAAGLPTQGRGDLDRQPVPPVLRPPERSPPGPRAGGDSRRR